MPLSLPNLSAHWYAECVAHTDSTMLQLRRPEWAEHPETFALLHTDYQTAGRGQRGTVWESAPGENLLFGIVFRPTFLPAAQQFCLSEALALAVADAVGQHTDGISVKWPNDIYWHDRKLAGMLLEHTLRGSRIAHTLAGVGLNVNQREFAGDAPNPVSLRQVVGHGVPRAALLESILQHFEANYFMLQRGGAEQLHARYLQCLYRREGWHAYRDGNGPFTARIAGISPQGVLTLERPDGQTNGYAFKEVSFLQA